MLTSLPFPRLRYLGPSPYSRTCSKLSRKKSPKRKNRWPCLDRERAALLPVKLGKDHRSLYGGTLPWPVSLLGEEGRDG